MTNILQRFPQGAVFQGKSKAVVGSQRDKGSSRKPMLQGHYST